MTSKEIIDSFNTENKIIPTKEDIKQNPILEYYEEIINEALKKDPTIIELIKGANLKKKHISTVMEQGLIITEEILKENPILTQKKELMEYAINYNPKLVLYANCYLKPEIIDKVLENYKITKEDIKNHKNLLNQYTLLENFPELEEYTKYAQPIIKLKDALVNNEEISKIKLVGEKEEIIKELAQLLIEEEITTEKEQEEAYRNLTKIIDKIIQIRYKNKKIKFEYPDIITLNDTIIKTFQEIDEINLEEKIEELTNKISIFIDGKMKRKLIKKQLLKYYKNYVLNFSLIIAETEKFCNKILNIHRDNFINKENKIIIENLKQQLTLTKKKKTEIYTRRKLKIITNNIKEGIITDIEPKMYNLRNEFKHNKKMKKAGVIITDEMYEMLEKIYKKNGTLNNSPVDIIIKTNNKDVIKYVINKYEKLKLQYLKQTKLKNKKITEEEKQKISLNTKNFIIDNKEYSNYQIATLLITKTKEELEELLKYKENIKKIKGLLPYINLFQEISTQALIEIIKSYDETNNKTLYNRQNIYENLDEIILTSTGYYKVTNTIINALTLKVINGLGKTHIKKYLEFYLEMLEQQTTNIPPIELEYNNLTLTSGNYDSERLLIGKIEKMKSSCIDLLDIGGKRTYIEALASKQGDVILIKENDKLISRILVFRRGNTIQLISQQEQKQNIELYQLIAKEIKLKSENDNIDCIVVNENSVIEQNIAKLKDSRFINEFPHADTSDKVIVLYKNNKEIDFKEQPKKTYEKTRKPINYNPTKLDILRIKSLYVSKTQIKNIPNYEDYKTVITGEDWLIAKTEDNIEELIINKENIQTQNEIKEAKQNLKCKKIGERK